MHVTFVDCLTRGELVMGVTRAAIGYRLSAISYQLSAIGYQLSAISYRPSGVGKPSHFSLLTPPAAGLTFGAPVLPFSRSPVLPFSRSPFPVPPFPRSTVLPSPIPLLSYRAKARYSLR